LPQLPRQWASLLWPSKGILRRVPWNKRQTGGIANDRLDGTNRRLLAELQRDARLSLAELGRRVGLSPPSVADRLARLEADGVISGYRTDVDPRALGLALTAVIRVRPAPRQLPKVAELARETPEVVECHRITGEDCFLIKAHLRDVEHLEEVIDRFVTFGQTTTSILQSSPVPGRAVAIDELAP
jgi:Lrp/AsnC family transcriptional regulator, leucine-responsive regulatory protein